MARSFTAALLTEISFPNDARLEIGATEDFTVCVWLRSPVSPPQSSVYVARRNGMSGTGWDIGFTNGQQIEAAINSASSSEQRVTGVVPTLFDGNWHLILMEVDRNVGIYLWADNVLVGTKLGNSEGSLANGLPLTIGAGNGTKHSSGVFSELSIFRRLLAAGEKYSLWQRFDGQFFRPNIHAPLFGNDSPEPDEASGLLGTLINAPAKAEHKRTIFPSEPFIYRQVTKDYISGSLDGAGTLTAALSAQVPVAGYVAGQSDLSAKLIRIRSLLGSIDAWSDLTAWLISDVPLQGNLPATSALPGNLTFLWRLWGEIHGQSNLPGFLRASVPIRGALNAQGDLDGWLMAVLDLGGQLNGDSTLLGKLRAAVPIAGSLDAVGDLDATLTRIRQISALLAGNSVLSARLVRRTAFRGIIDGWGDLTGIPRVAYATKGALDGDSDLTGKTSSLLAARGVLPGTSDLAGKLALQILMAGSLASTSDLQAYIRRRFRVSGEILANSDLMGRLEAWAWLQGIIEGDSSIEGMLTRLAGLAGEIEAESELTGRLRIPGQSEQTSVGGKAYTTGVGGYIARWYRGLP